MKPLLKLIFFLFLFTSPDSFGQQFAVSMTAMNYGYFGVNNEIDIVVSECKCSDLIVTTDNGIISGLDCHYNLKPDRIGTANISIKVKRKKSIDSLGTDQIIIYRVPDPVVTSSAFYFTDTITNKDELILHPLLICRIPGFRIDYTFRIIQYRLTIYRNDAIYYQEKVLDNSFSKDMKSKFSGLLNNDILVFDEIIIESGEGKRNLRPFKKTYFNFN